MPDTPHNLAGPDAITIRRTRRGGPFAARGRPLALLAERFTVVNTGAAALTLDRLTVDPVRDAASGLAAPGRLAIAADAAVLAPGSAAALALSGELPGRPGRFATSARLSASDGTALACPVAIEISAHPGWGILAMLLGLLAIGLLNLLTGAGDVAGTLRHALESQRDITVTLERTPPPASLAGERATMDDDYRRAIAGLQEPRAASLVDHRQADAQVALDAAGAIAARLRASVADRVPGETEIEDLETDWKALQPVLRPMMAPAPAATGATGIAADMAAYLAAERDRLVREPAIEVASEIEGALGRMKLEAASGDGEAARALALNTRLWLQRSAVSLERGAMLDREGVGIAMVILNDDAELHARLATDDIPAEARTAIEATLAAAEAKLARHPTATDVRDASFMINRASTDRTRAVQRALHARITDAYAALDHGTDISDIQALLDHLNAAPGPHTLAVKQAGLSQVIGLWRAHVAVLPDPADAQAKNRELDVIQSLIDQGRLPNAAPLLQAFFEGWPGEFRRLAGAARDRLEHRGCVEYGRDLERRRARIEWELRPLPASPQVTGWDGRLDAIRFDLQRRGPDAVAITHDCIGTLLTIDRQIERLENEMLASGLVNASMSNATRTRLLAGIPNVAATGITASDFTGARHLALVITTPPDERVAGRAIAFRLDGADPNWGSATKVTIGFGDATAASMNAETRRRTPIVHSYARAIPAHLTVHATTAEMTVGDGVADMVVRASPLTGARIVADEFVSLRFGLALAIAGVVYFWRYRNGHAVFGARAYDYVEAFALGFAVYAAVSDLPRAIAGFVT